MHTTAAAQRRSQAPCIVRAILNTQNKLVWFALDHIHLKFITDKEDTHEASAAVDAQ